MEWQRYTIIAMRHHHHAIAADITPAYKFDAESIAYIYKLLALIYYTLEAFCLYIDLTNIKKSPAKPARELGKCLKRSKYI